MNQANILTPRTLATWLAAVLLAMLWLATPARAEEYLEPEAAFKFSARMRDEHTVSVSFAIADGYYMYRERFEFQAAGAKLGPPQFPPGKVKFDETFQKDVETFRNQITIDVPVEAAQPFTFAVTSQGCADKGLCYAPQRSEIKLAPAAAGGLSGAIADARSESGNSAFSQSPSSTLAQSAATSAAPDSSGMGNVERSLQSGKLAVIVPLFLIIGLGLSFTPCVLPMVPILSSIIVGEGANVSRSRGFLLSFAYSLGMAIVYTLLGIAAGLAGEGLAAALQNPWVLGTFALMMATMSLSMFNVFQLQMPAALQTRLAQASERQAAGKFAGVFMMGAISSLIVGPCVAAPLAGALVYISQTRNVLVGGTALFAMAVGMSVPLLLIGLSAGALLPRAGRWMESVKQFFGILLLAMAWWMVAPVLPAWVQMCGWAALGIGYGAYLLATQRAVVAKVAAVVFVLTGAVQLVGVSTGGRDPWAPLAHLSGKPAHTAEFARVRSVAELDHAIAAAGGKPVMLDFYADWCVSCKEMEKLTFSDPKVAAQLGKMVLLQADVTANNEDDKQLLKRFRLFGPPGIIFFDKQGREIQGGRVIGYQDVSKFLTSLDLVMQF